ncbi:MAG TPA: HAMP domain-containing sensor histidine kinase [Actinomycetota bacterium]|nr:HAMP domain-containing sensor histidine kinase [Actinomycetota bacterium]
MTGEQEGHPLRTERVIAFVRAGVVALNTLTYLQEPVPAARRPVAYALIVSACLYAALGVYVARRGWTGVRGRVERPAWAIGSTVADVVFIGLWVWATGSASSPYDLLFHAEAVATVGRFGLRIGCAYVAGAALPYAWIVAAGGATLRDVVVRIGYLAVVTVFAGYFVEEARHSERHAAAAEAHARSLDELAHLKDGFITQVSHELRTPLTGVRGAARTLSTRARDLTDDQRELLVTMIDRQSARLTVLIEDILDFSKTEGGLVQLAPTEVDVESLIDAVVAGAVESGAPNVRAGSVPPGASLLCDRDKLTRALAKLVENAVKFSAPESPVVVSASDVDGWIYITVTDRGEGIPHEEQRRIFDSFHRAGTASTRVTEGIGIGLSIAEGLVRLHGGRIEVRSEPGEGSAFTICVPRRGGEIRLDAPTSRLG